MAKARELRNGSVVALEGGYWVVEECQVGLRFNRLGAAVYQSWGACVGGHGDAQVPATVISGFVVTPEVTADRQLRMFSQTRGEEIAQQ